MDTITRRVFGVGAFAAVSQSVASAGTLTRGEDEAPPGVEFAGRPHQNPKSIGSGVITVSGVALPPAGCKIVKVIVYLRKESDEQKDGHSFFDATLDLTKTPATWSVKLDRVEPGVYWVDAQVEFLNPNRERKTVDSLERRRVQVVRK